MTAQHAAGREGHVAAHHHLSVTQQEEEQDDGVITFDGTSVALLFDEEARERRAAISQEDWSRYQSNLAEILEALGMRLDTPGTTDTPRRFLQALYDSTEGYDGDPKLVTVFPTECYGGTSCELSQVVEGPIPFTALCEHHALPFIGTAYVGYVAHEHIIGISKLTRLVRIATRRFGVQERMTHQIAEALEKLTRPHGVAVYMEAHHLCTQMRGVREVEPVTRTNAFRGAYENDATLRAEFYDLTRARRRQPD
jgi:GTP cyclohydrolase I